MIKRRVAPADTIMLLPTERDTRPEFRGTVVIENAASNLEESVSVVTCQWYALLDGASKLELNLTTASGTIEPKWSV